MQKLLRKKYRDDFLSTTVKVSVAYQVQALRAKFSLSQADFATKLGKKQSTVSRLESTEYGKVTVQTLIDIASSLDVGLVVRFVDYPTFLGYAEQMAEWQLQPLTIVESCAKLRTNRLASSHWQQTEVGQPVGAMKGPSVFGALSPHRQSIEVDNSASVTSKVYSNAA